MQDDEVLPESQDDLFFNVQEARIHLQKLEAELGGSDAVDPITLLVQLGHIQEHLCLAWNSGVGKRSDVDVAYQIPNWTSNFELIDPKF